MKMCIPTSPIHFSNKEKMSSYDLVPPVAIEGFEVTDIFPKGLQIFLLVKALFGLCLFVVTFLLYQNLHQLLLLLFKFGKFLFYFHLF